MSSNDTARYKDFDPAGMSAEEILAKVKSEGYELTDKQLEAVSGGGMWDAPASDGCPKCGSHDISYSNIGHTMHFKCKNCGHEWC